MSRVQMPTAIATTFLDDQGRVTYTGYLDGPYKRLKQLSDGRIRGGASLDLVSTEQAQSYADKCVREALESAADIVAANAAACHDQVNEMLLRTNEQAIRAITPGSPAA